MSVSEPENLSERRDPALTDTLTFRLIVAMNLIVKPFATIYGEAHGISLSEWRCLIWLAAAPGSSGEDTASGIGMDRMSVSRNLRALQRKGYASRTPDPNNRKRWQWRLSSLGWSVFDEIAAGAIERDHAITATMTRDEQARMIRFLDDTIAMLRAADREQRSR